MCKVVGQAHFDWKMTKKKPFNKLLNVEYGKHLIQLKLVKLSHLFGL